MRNININKRQNQVIRVVIANGARHIVACDIVPCAQIQGDRKS